MWLETNILLHIEDLTRLVISYEIYQTSQLTFQTGFHHFESRHYFDKKYIDVKHKRRLTSRKKPNFHSIFGEKN